MENEIRMPKFPKVSSGVIERALPTLLDGKAELPDAPLVGGLHLHFDLAGMGSSAARAPAHCNVIGCDVVFTRTGAWRGT